MARIRDYAVTIFSADTTSAVADMPVHQTGDLLLAFASKDGTATITPPGTWYTSQNSASTGAYAGVYSRRAQSSSETATFTTGTLDAWVILIVSIEGTFGSATNGSDAFSTATTVTAVDSTVPYNAGSITPAHNNCLVFSFINTDATYGILPIDLGWPVIFSGDSATNSLCVSYTQQKTAAALTGPTYLASAGLVDDTMVRMVAIRDDGNGTKYDAYIDRGTIPAYTLSRLTGSSTGDVGSPTYIAANSVALTSVLVNGSTSKTCTGLATTATADSGYSPFSSTATTAGSSSTTNLGTSEFTCSWNCTQGLGLIFGIWRPTIPRDYVDLGSSDRGGVLINFTNGSTANARAWVVGGQFSKTTKASDYNPFVIQVQQTSNTAYAWNGTVTWSTISRVSFGSSSYYGAASTQWQAFYALNKVVFAGGSSSNPFGLDDIVNVVNNGCGVIPIIDQAGSAITSRIPLQFGGGDAVHVDVDLATIQFPRKADGTDYLDFHVDNDVVGCEFYGTGSTDTIRFTNTVFTSPSSYHWRFNASHSASTVADFSGSSVINASVTLRSTSNLTSVSFIGCALITSANSTLTDCNFVATRDTSGCISITGSTQSELQTNLNKFVTCSFTENTIGPALVINYTGTGNVSLDMSALTFSGNTTDIRWQPTNNVNLTINKLLGSNPSTSSSSQGSVNITSSATVQLTGLVSNSEVRAYLGTNPATATEINGTENSGTSFSFGQSYSGQDGYIVILNNGYQAMYLPITYSGSDQSIPIQQTKDRQYLNP